MRKKKELDAVSWGRRKNRVSIGLYALAVGLSLVYPPLGAVVHVVLAVIWLMPESSKAGV